MKICITGGSGFVGTKLAAAFASAGHSVLILDRAAPKAARENVFFIQTDLSAGSITKEALECDAIIHLAGANIFGRWTPEYKKLILSSRVDSAKALFDAFKNSAVRPKTFVSASAVGYYGDVGETELTEESANGTDFLAGVCKEWEASARKFEELGMRSVSIRTGIVLGPGGGMLAKLVPIFKWGLGGPMGSGRQWFSWIHIDDLVSVYVKAVTDERLSGPVNAVSPSPVRNKEFASELGAALHRPAFIPVPRFALRMVLGELAGAVLSSQRVLPKKLLAMGFDFKYKNISDALK